MSGFTKWLLMALLASIFAAGNAIAGGFGAYIADPDKFHPDREHRFSDDIDIKALGLFDPGYSKFSLNYVKSAAGNYWYLKTTYHSSDWIFVENLLLNIDGKNFSFRSSPSPVRETGIFVDPYVEEINIFVIPDPFIEVLQNAKSISVRLEGQRYYQDRDLTPDDVRNIGWFAGYIKGLEQKAKDNNEQQKTSTAQPAPGTKPRLGLSFIDLPPDVAAAIHRDNLKAVIVIIIEPNSVAAKAGFAQGDIIQQYNGKPIEKVAELQKAVSETKAGDKVSIKLIREEKEMTLTAQF